MRSTPGEPSQFSWRCPRPEQHEQHRIEGDGYYGPAGYICDGEPATPPGGGLAVELDAIGGVARGISARAAAANDGDAAALAILIERLATATAALLPAGAE